MIKIVQAASKTQTISHLLLRLTSNPVTLTWSCSEEQRRPRLCPPVFLEFGDPAKKTFHHSKIRLRYSLDTKGRIETASFFQQVKIITKISTLKQALKRRQLTIALSVKIGENFKRNMLRTFRPDPVNQELYMRRNEPVKQI
jgi:hypothetical protein